jgi:hypothetical protein
MKAKRFDAVRFMRKARERIGKEDAGLSWHQISRKTSMLVDKDPLWSKLKQRVLSTQPATARGLR